MKAALFIAGGTLAQLVLGSPLENALLARKDGSCGTNLKACNPSGASAEKLPSLGPELSGLYLALLDSVKGINFEQKRSSYPLQRRDTPSFCCATGTSCLTLSTFSVPFCYDKFTTNFLFPDGSSGTIHDGTFSSPDGGASADLFSGAYTNGSTKGNLYADDTASKPNTATLSIPPQYTASGVGSAIPLTALGTVVVVTTTVSASVIVPPTTVPATTIPGTTIEGSTTRADSVVPASTITAASTVSAHETVMTMTSSLASGTAAATATGGAGRGVAGGFGGALVGVAGAWAWAVL